MKLTRRRVLTGSASAAVASFFSSGAVFATLDNVTTLVNGLSSGESPTDGVIELTIPEIAENGNSVPISVSVDSPMTADDHVDSIMILADANPHPEVATFYFTELSGEAKVTTRMRLAATQAVVAIAKMSDGSFRETSIDVRVTIGGCGA